MPRVRRVAIPYARPVRDVRAPRPGRDRVGIAMTPATYATALGGAILVVALVAFVVPRVIDAFLDRLDRRDPDDTARSFLSGRWRG